MIKNDFLRHKQANINVKSRRFGIIMTPFSRQNEYRILLYTFEFFNEVQSLEINRGDILVSYDVTSLFTNVPLDETIQILADKAFTDDWFNKTHELNLSRDQLIELLHAATIKEPTLSV